MALDIRRRLETNMAMAAANPAEYAARPVKSGFKWFGLLAGGLISVGAVNFALDTFNEGAREAITDPSLNPFETLGKIKDAFRDTSLGGDRIDVSLQSPLSIGVGETPASETEVGATWECAEGVRGDDTINTYLGRLVIAEYGLGDHNDSATYDQAISLLNTSAFRDLNPHILDTNNPPMGEIVIYPNCELR